MPKPHVHAEVIKAFANGHEIETQDDCETWVDCENPRWLPYKKYRVKPAKKTLTLWAWIYPTTGELIWRLAGYSELSPAYLRIPSEDKTVLINLPCLTINNHSENI